jgi:hypothetical protein
MLSHTGDKILSWMDTLLSTSLDMANAVLRVLTFEDLGIRHTCHDVAIILDRRNQESCGRPPYSEEEIDEIHDEDSELITRLNLLCAEFETAYASSDNPSFYDFVKGYWTDRMNEDKKDRGADYVKAVEEIGVVVEPFGPELPPGFTRADRNRE